MKKTVIGIGVLAVCIVLGVFIYNRTTKRGLAKPLIVSTIYPWYDAASHISAKIAEVQVLVPAGVEPHEYEPTALDIIKANKADLFIYNGGMIDAWAERVAEERTKKGKLSFKAMDHVGKTMDPHIWLDPAQFLSVSRAMYTSLSILYKNQLGLITENTIHYVSDLNQLDREYQSGLGSCKKNTIAVSHDAFGHLAKRYNVKTISISGISPENEPSVKRMVEIARIVKEKNISYIFFETLISPKLATTVASETGASTLVLNPLEGLTAEEQNKGISYISTMKVNLKQLQIALECTQHDSAK